ncbi:MAG: hypothetical protein CMM52_07580 [Rhodospirillaceae bacterium]|nr:hypothetical protein [Rhodospirillaceae bacterium]|tara:strand:- start:5705 stop:6526 length:822 start_codon:yes stop_codon:yes gene_type:complete
MRFIVTALLFFTVVSSSALAASNERVLKLDYAIYVGGFRTIDIKLDTTLGANRYDINLGLKGEGLIDWLFKWSMKAFSNGQFKQGEIVPRKAGHNSVWRGKKRRVRLTFPEKGFPSAEVTPPPKTDDRKPVPLEKRLGTRDLAGAILSYLTEVGANDSCKRSEPVFDGRRRYNLVFEKQAKVNLRRTHYSPYAGPALRCSLRLEKIAGFRTKKSRYRWASDGTARVWIARPFPNALMIPVRLEMDTAFGGLVAHLIAAEQRHNGSHTQLTTLP